ncbi:MAG: GntR family transcriptional regulator [Enterocloster sp.]
MKIFDRQPAENARTYAVRVLLYNIINLELAPGSAVSENELSAVMDLSRTPAREALIELNKMGLVEIIPQRGSYIAKIDYELIEESRFMRLVLENAVLKLACENGISDHYMKLLRENLKLEKEYADTGDSAMQLDLDNHFHKLIFESVNKVRTYEIIHSQMVHFDRLRTLSLKSSKSERTVDDHENILYAIGRRDSELAEMLMTRHLSRFQVEKSELVKLYPDYFV